jgi:hypothetical protein
MRGAGAGGAAGFAGVETAGGALAEIAAGAGAEVGRTTGGAAGRTGGGADVIPGEVADGADATGGAASREVVTGAGGATLTAAGEGSVAGFTTGGATVVGRLTAAGGAAAGFSAGGRATGPWVTGDTERGGDGGTTVSFCCVIAFSTSPGREMCDKSILVLISSSPRIGREPDFPDDEEPSAAERMYTRTFSASCSSSELECVFFSVTPTSGRVSRIALLFTSSSLARSLIRTLLIRPFVSPCCS